MKKRNLWAMVGISLITFQLYAIYWMFKTQNELKTAGSPKVPTPWVWFGPLVGLFGAAFFFALLLAFQSDAAMLFAILLTFLYIMGSLAIIGLYIWWSYYYSIAASAVIKGAQSKDFIFWIGILFNFFSLPAGWCILVQYEYNKLIDENPDVANPNNSIANHPAAPGESTAPSSPQEPAAPGS